MHEKILYKFKESADVGGFFFAYSSKLKRETHIPALSSKIHSIRALPPCAWHRGESANTSGFCAFYSFAANEPISFLLMHVNSSGKNIFLREHMECSPTDTAAAGADSISAVYAACPFIHAPSLLFSYKTPRRLS